MFTPKIPRTLYFLPLVIWLLLVIPAGAAALIQAQVLKASQGRLDGLDNGGKGVFSPDGQFLYVENGATALTVYRWDVAMGKWVFVEQQQDGVNGVDGLDSLENVVISADGKYVYTVTQIDDAVVTFKRDTTTGKLTYVDMQKDNVNGVDGLDLAYDLAISPDQKHLYVAGMLDHAIAIFARNSTTGRLTYVGKRQDGLNGVDGLNQICGLVVSPDGKHVYATGMGDSALVTFSRNATTGLLAFEEMYQNGVGGVTGLTGAPRPAISPDGQYIYIAGGNNIGTLLVFRRSAETGLLTFIETKVEGQPGVGGLNWLVWLAISQDSRTIYTAGTGGAVTTFQRNGTTGQLTQLQVFQDGLTGIDGLAWTTWVGLSPDGQRLYALAKDDQALAAFSRNEASGLLTFSGKQQNGEGPLISLTEAYKLSLSPDGKFVYTTGKWIGVFRRTEASGQLAFVEGYQAGVGNLAGIERFGMPVVSPDGEQVYISEENGIILFDRAPTNGQLTFIEAYRDGENGLDTLLQPLSHAFSPDGQYLYVTSYIDQALTVFRRDRTTGQLSLVKAYRNGEANVNGLASPTGIAFSPDGHYLYVAGLLSSSVAIFHQHPDTGELSYEGIVQSDSDLKLAWALQVSPDGQHLYVIGAGGTLAVFQRDPATGQLTFLEVHRDNQAGVDGLANPSSLALNPAGSYLYVTGRNDNALAIFHRNPITGRLTFSEVKKDDLQGIDGLKGATDVLVSSDSQYIFTIGTDEDALAVFKTPILNYLPLVTRW